MKLGIVSMMRFCAEADEFKLTKEVQCSCHVGSQLHAAYFAVLCNLIYLFTSVFLHKLIMLFIYLEKVRSKMTKE